MSEILQLFVSAPGPGKRRPYYKRDVLNICCAPAGESISLSYKHDWLTKGVLDRVQANQVKGLEALLIFCAETTAEEIYSFFPLRYAKVVDVFNSGDGTTLFLQAAQFCTYDEKMHATIQKWLRDVASQHPAHPASNGKAHPDAKFVRIVDSKFTIEKAANGWEALVDKVSRVNGLSDSVFFIATATTTNPVPVRIMDATSNNAAHRQECVVEKGAHKEIDLYVRSGSNAEFSPPTIDIRNDIASYSGPFVRQFQKGFVCHYIIDFKKGLDKESSLLRIGLPVEKAPLVFRSPEVSIHVISNAARGLPALVVFLLTAGTLITSLGPDSLEPLLGMFSWQGSKESLGSLSAVAKAIGTLMFGVGAWLGFRELPFKGG